MGRLRSLLAIFFALTVALVACDGLADEPEEAGSSVAGSAAESSADVWNSVTDRLGENGEPTPDLALEAFSAAVAPLPGIGGSNGQPPVFAGPVALSWVVRVWDQLSEEDQAHIQSVMDAALFPETGSSGMLLAVAGLGDLLTAGESTTTCREDPEWQGLAAKSLVDISQHVMPLPDITVSTCVSSQYQTPVPFALNADGNFRGGKAESCVIVLPDNAEFDRHISGHEAEVMTFLTFDCVMAGTAPDIRVLHQFPSWIRFGADRFVAARLATGSPWIEDGSWETWLGEPQIPLFARASDAVGFYDLVSDAKSWEFEVIPIMLFYLTATGNAEPAAEVSLKTYDAAISDLALTWWGGAYVNDPSLDPTKGFWFQNWPYQITDGFTFDSAFPGIDHEQAFTEWVSNGSEIGLHVDPYTALSWWVDFQADVVVMELRPDNVGTTVIGGAVARFVDELGLVEESEATFEFTRTSKTEDEPAFDLYGQMLLPDNSYLELPAVGPSMWCTLATDCSCPGGSPGAERLAEKMPPGTALVSLSGHHEGTVLNMTGYSLDDFCNAAINRRPVEYWLTGGEWKWSHLGGQAENGCTWPTVSGSGDFGDDPQGKVLIDWYSKPVRWWFSVDFATRLEAVTVPECFTESGQRKYREFEWEPLVSGQWSYQKADSDYWIEGERCQANHSETWGESNNTWLVRLVDGPCAHSLDELED